MTQNWKLTGDEVLALPLDELALHVLRDAVENAADINSQNWRTWLLAVQQHVYPKRPIDVLQALGEAWGWIQQHGLITWHPMQSSEQSFVLSRKGREALEQGLIWLRAVERLDIQLVPELEFTARPQFIRGDFEMAAFAAMRAVEVQVRARANLGSGPDEVGVKLMTKAFRQGGPLFRNELEGGESQALMNLFAGSIGLFKNPASHRRVDFKDATEAAEIVLLADLLLRLLAKIEDPVSSTTSAP